MKKTYLKSYLLIIAVLLAFIGCKKTALEQVTSNTTNKNTLTPYSFDWETADYMPAPNGTKILVPWASNANQSFPISYVTDIKKSDGWELVYNTFSPTEIIQPAFFVLYNRYRGTLRGYFYLTPTSPIPSSYVSHSLVQKTSSSDAQILSYSGSGFADLSVKNNIATLVQSYKTNPTGTWYAAEFEMAYDPSVGTKPAGTNLMSWEINSINSSDIKINGTSQGSTHGTIAQPVAAPGLFSALLDGGLQVYSVASLTDMKIPFQFVDALKNAVKSGFSGNIRNVANAIFGGKSSGDSTRQYVNLTTNTKYTLAGTATDIYQLASPSMPIPGSNGQESVTGFAPLYTKPLGIMNLSAAPKAVPTYEPTQGITVLKLDPASYQIIWNPNIINGSTTGATIKNLKQEILTYENYYYDEMHPYNPYPTELNEFDGDKPYLKNELLKDGKPWYRRDYELMFEEFSSCYGCDNNQRVFVHPIEVGKKLPKHVLRVSFNVVPNNGGATVTIAKSFNIILMGAFPLD